MKQLTGTKTLSKIVWQQSVDNLKSAIRSVQGSTKLYKAWSGRLESFEKALNSEIRAKRTTAKEHSEKLAELVTGKRKAKRDMERAQDVFVDLYKKAGKSVKEATKADDTYEVVYASMVNAS